MSRAGFAFSTPLSRRRGPAEGDGFRFGEWATQSFEAQAEQREHAARTLREYAELIPEPNIGPLRFEDFPFHEEWYSEEVADAEEVVMPKSAQVGATTWAWRGTVRRVDQFGDRALYIFPTDKHVTEFGDERIEPAIEGSSYLQMRIPASFVKTKSLKRIGQGFLYLRGSNSKAGAQSVPAQMLVFDEYDLLDQKNLKQIERRISGAIQTGKKPRVWRLGYPFTPNAGIDKEHRSSDQRVWHIVCSGCGLEQPVVWEENFRWTVPGYHEGATEDNPRGDPELPLRVMRPGDDAFEDPKALGDVWRACRECDHRLEDTGPYVKDGDLRRGRWIPQNPGASAIGYHAWRGMVPVTDLRSLVIASRGTSETDIETFMVLDLGRPYAPGSARLTDEDLVQAQRLGLARAVESYTGPYPTTMGIDVGDEKGIHVWIDEQLPQERADMPNPRRALWIGKVSSFEEAARLMDVFRVSVAAVDYNPERRLARSLRGAYPGRVVLVEFATTFNSDPMKLDMDPADVPLRALVNRTDMLDAMMDAIRQQRSRPLQAVPQGWAEQMKSLVRKTTVNTRGQPVRTYETTGSAGEDYAMAAGYAVVATELWRAFGQAQALLVAQQGHILREQEMGFRPVRLGMDAEAGGGRGGSSGY